MLPESMDTGEATTRLANPKDAAGKNSSGSLWKEASSPGGSQQNIQVVYRPEE